jgi:membrane protein required for colicin V production
VAAFDWIALGVLGISLLVGAWRGLVYELLSVLGWVAAFVLAQMFAPSVATSLPMSGSPEVLRYAAAFVLVFIGVAFAAGLLSWLVKKLIEAVGLRGAVLLLAAAVVVGMTPFKEAAWWKDSSSAPVLVTGLKGLKPVLPADFGRYLP